MKFKYKLTPFLAATLLFASQAFATYQPQNPNGSATSANSTPVVVASDQAAVAANITKIGSTTLAFGQALSSASIPVTLAAPNMASASVMTRPGDTTAYAVGDLVANSTTAGSVIPLQFTIAPSNGVPVFILKGKMLTSTSGGAGVSPVNGTFRLHLFSSAPTVANGDNGAYSATLANWCGDMDGTLINQGTDASVAELTPVYGSFVSCQPAGGSQIIYGLIEARASFTPTNAETFTFSIMGQ